MKNSQRIRLNQKVIKLLKTSLNNEIEDLNFTLNRLNQEISFSNGDEIFYNSKIYSINSFKKKITNIERDIKDYEEVLNRL